MKVAFEPAGAGDPLQRNGRLIADMGGCSLWWGSALALNGAPTGLIGEYESADGETAMSLLAEATARLRDAGCAFAIGPMDGSTWRKYRFVTSRGSMLPFFLEPDNPDSYPAQFERAGFKPLATYFSAITCDLSTRDQRSDKISERMSNSGVRIRAVDLNAFDDELRRIFAVSREAFTENFLYTPISESEFMELYRPIRPFLLPDLILIAECEGAPIGYVFAMPDHARAQREELVDAIVVKTLAVLPGRRIAGLGSLLLDHVHAAAHTLGFRKAIHALMHESNVSRNLSARTAEIFRRYTLFAQLL
jgi:GNAT superfamily N-acetyltransferase